CMPACNIPVQLRGQFQFPEGEAEPRKVEKRRIRRQARGRRQAFEVARQALEILRGVIDDDGRKTRHQTMRLVRGHPERGQYPAGLAIMAMAGQHARQPDYVAWRETYLSPRLLGEPAYSGHFPGSDGSPQMINQAIGTVRREAMDQLPAF